MSGIFFSDDVKIISGNGSRGISIARAYFKDSDGSPITIPIQCDKLRADHISRGWTEGLVVTSSSEGNPYIRPEEPFDERAAYLIIPSVYATARIHKLLKKQHNVGLFTGLIRAEGKRRVTEGAIIRLMMPGDVVRIMKRGGVPDEEDRFFVLLPDGRIEEAQGAEEVQSLYIHNSLTIPFGFVAETVDQVRRFKDTVVGFKRISKKYEAKETEWAHIS